VERGCIAKKARPRYGLSLSPLLDAKGTCLKKRHASGFGVGCFYLVFVRPGRLRLRDDHLR
jgi:hypothetical protein